MTSPSWTAEDIPVNEGKQLNLYFGTHLIGAVSDTYDSDLTWYGTIRLADELPPRIRQFIKLCKDWHRRSQAGEPHDAAEFDAWRDVHESAEWRTQAEDGSLKQIAAPFFWPDDDLCWRDAEKGESHAGPDRGQSVEDIEGPWTDASFESGLIERCKRHWSVPMADLPNTILATYIRQRIALSLVVPEARRRLEAGFRDDSEVYDGELAAALAEAGRR